MTIKLIKDLNFADKLNSCEAVTESGKECLKNYRGYCYNNAATCGLVNNFIKEAQKYSYDSGVTSILESVVEFVNSNKISWKLASVCEAINNNTSSYNVLNRAGVEKVEKLLEMDETNVISYIKAGALRGVQYIPEFRAVCKEVYGNKVNENKNTLAYSVSTPVSYIIIDENKNQIVNVNGKVFRISENKVEETTCEDADFNKINAHLANMKLVGESLIYTYRPAYLANENKFTVTESNIEFTNGKVNESFTSADRFKEYCDTFTRTMINPNESRLFMMIAGAIAEVFEAMDRIGTIDNAKLFNCANGATVAVIESAGDINVTLYNSYGNVNETNNYSVIKEALNSMKSNYGLNLENLYVKRIAEDATKSNTPVVDDFDNINIRLNKINELTEQFKDDPEKLLILNELTKKLKEMKNE